MKLLHRLLSGFTVFLAFFLLTCSPVLAFDYVIYDCPEGVCNVPLYPVPDLSKPDKGKPIKDPNFHTQIARITGKDTDQYISRLILNTYSRNNPVNADGSKMILMGGARYYIYDASTFQLLRRLSQYDGGQIPCCHEIEPRWDASNPNVFYYRSGTQLVKYDYLADSSTLIRDFSQDFPAAADIYTRTEGAPSRDSRYWAFTARGGYPDYEWVAAFTYDMEEDRILGTINTPAIHDTLSISPLGDRVIVDYNWPGQVTSYALDFTDPVEIGTIGHSDLTINSDGRQVRVFEDPSSDWIVMADLETGERSNLLKLPLTGNWTTSSGNHISGSDYNTPGWVLMSTYGTTEKTGGTWPFNLMFMLELKENPRIWLIGHTHCPQSQALGRDYWAEAFAAIDRRGNKVFWGSNWDNAGPETPIDAYQITLPENWYSVLSGDGSDIVPPSRSNGQPATTLAVDTNQVNVSLETNENATCKYSISTTRVAYADMVDTFADTGGLSHSFTMTGLINGQSYNLYVRCLDDAGNVNIDDFPISFNVASGSEGGELDKVLFIGNSYTGHSGGIQNHFQSMMEESGRTVEVAGEIHGGEAFSYKNENYPGQANRPEVTARIQSNDWDAVVLQSYYEDEQAFYDAGGILIDRVKNNSSDPILFMIWGHELHPDQDTMFRQRTEQLGSNKETQVAPIGVGIRAAYNAGLPVYLDGGHLSLSGAYMAGAMYYAFFTGESPVGLQYDGFVGSGYFGRLTEEEITPLQELAWQVVNDYGVFWHKEPTGETPPTLSNGHPKGTLPAGTETTTVSLSTNRDATCRYSLNTAHVSYDDMTGSFTTTGETSHAAELTELTDGTGYKLYVRCRDLSGNANKVDYPITFTVAENNNSSTLEKILFIGGLYTANAGGVHKHFQKMMEESGKTVAIADSLYGGEPFFRLNDQYPGIANREEVTDKISSEQWDAIVLQSQGLAETADQFNTAGNILIDRVKENGSKPVLYMIWGRKSYPAQDLLYKQRYEQLGQETATPVVPIGIGIRSAHEQGIEVYNGEAQLNLKGAYLAGAIFYAYFTGESPVGLQYDGYIGSGYFGRLPPEETAILQAHAWQVVNDYGVFYKRANPRNWFPALMLMLKI